MEHSIACTLSPAEHRQRTDELTTFATRGLRSRDKIGDGLRLVFSDNAENERDLRAAIAMEAECCPFLKLELTRFDHGLVLEITGPQDAQGAIAELFRMSLPEKLLGAGALVMALCCTLLPLAGAALGGGLIAGAGTLGFALGVVTLALVGVAVARRRRGARRC